jgi:tRNA-dihydrouridine synthase B
LIARFDFTQRRFILAPLAGWTDPPFRAAVKRFGADLTVSEMISANALVHNLAKTKKLYEKSPLETPYAVQIAGSDIQTLTKAAMTLSNETDIDIIDLNAGCPAQKVTRNGAGAALLKDPSLLGKLVGAIKRAAENKLISVKIRLGYDKNNGVEIARVCEESGADFIAVHGRTKIGGFSAPVDYEAIGEIKTRLKIPAIANGDIDSYEKAQAVLDATNADGAMIGRGATGAPWIFAQLKNNLSSAGDTLMRSVILEHFDRAVEFYGERGAILFRKHLHRYSKGREGAAAFRSAINRESDLLALRAMIGEFFEAR